MPGRFEGAVIGYRTWLLEAGRLRAAVIEYAWQQDGPNKAICIANGNHTHPPYKACHCGFNVFHEPPDDLYTCEGVLGAVVAWGKIHVHKEGFRAEYVLPVALCKLPTMMVHAYEAAQGYCEEWDLPWCETVEELQREALRYAAPIPEEDRPEDSCEFTPPPPPTVRGTKGLLPRVGGGTFTAASAPRRPGAYVNFSAMGGVVPNNNGAPPKATFRGIDVHYTGGEWRPTAPASRVKLLRPPKANTKYTGPKDKRKR
jgi:hypothetical protein